MTAFFGDRVLRFYDDGGVAVSRTGGARLLDDQAPADTLIQDSVKRLKEQLAQVPEGKTKVLVAAVDWKFGVIPTARIGYVARFPNGWDVHGEAFLSKANKGASIVAVKSW